MCFLEAEPAWLERIEDHDRLTSVLADQLTELPFDLEGQGWVRMVPEESGMQG